MTLSTIVEPKWFAGDGATVAFVFPFLFLQNADIQVYLQDDTSGAFTLQTITTHYTLVGAGVGTGTVTFVVAPASGKTVWIFRNTANTQELDLNTGNNLPSASLEAGFDKVTMLVQDRLGREQEDRLYLEMTATQNITPAGSDTNITTLSGGPLPNVSADARDDLFECFASIQVDGLGALECQLVCWNGANGNSADGSGKVVKRTYHGGDSTADARTMVQGPFLLRPGTAGDVKIGWGIQTASGTFDIHGVSPRTSWILVKKLR